MVEDAKRCGVDIILDHPVAQWAVRYDEWIQHVLVESGVDLSGGGTKKSRVMKHIPETKHRATLLDSWNEFLFEAKSTMTNSSDFWLVGHLVKKTLTSSLSWKTEVCVTTVRGNSVPKDAVMQTSMNFRVRTQRWKNTKPKGARLLGMRTWNQRHSWSEHTFECPQTSLPSLVPASFWTVTQMARCSNFMNMEVMMNTEIQNACDSHTT